MDYRHRLHCPVAVLTIGWLVAPHNDTYRLSFGTKGLRYALIVDIFPNGILPRLGDVSNRYDYKSGGYEIPKIQSHFNLNGFENLGSLII